MKPPATPSPDPVLTVRVRLSKFGAGMRSRIRAIRAARTALKPLNPDMPYKREPNEYD